MSTDNAGHCDHCRAGCVGGEVVGSGAWISELHHHNLSGALWPSGHCPACAEATDTAAALERIRDSAAFADDMAGQAVVDMCRKVALGIVQA